MKVIVNGNTYDGSEVPILLVFEDDAERKQVIGNLVMMQEKTGKRVYAEFPNDMPKEEKENIWNYHIANL